MSCFMWSGALDLQLCCSSITSYNITTIAHNQYTDINVYPLINIKHIHNAHRWAPKYFEITLCYACILFCYECAARLLSVVNKDPLLGMLGYLNLWYVI